MAARFGAIPGPQQRLPVMFWRPGQLVTASHCASGNEDGGSGIAGSERVANRDLWVGSCGWCMINKAAFVDADVRRTDDVKWGGFEAPKANSSQFCGVSQYVLLACNMGIYVFKKVCEIYRLVLHTRL